MDEFRDLELIVVGQKKEMLEVLTAFETRNKYRVTDSTGRELFFAEEQKRSMFSWVIRWLLKSLRPFEIELADVTNKLCLSVKRPFRFYFHEAEIFDSLGNSLGKAVREFSITKRILNVSVPGAENKYKLIAPFFHPWTFAIEENGQEIGQLCKKWSGLAKEIFTDADNFSLHFPRQMESREKALLLGVLFLVDMVFFESSN